MYFVERHENKLYAAKKSDKIQTSRRETESHEWVRKQTNIQACGCCCLLKGLGTVKHTLVRMLMKS